MSAILIRGLHSLKGEIRIQGSKNAVLPVMAASLLHRGTVVITNVPRIQDVFCMMGILEYMGCLCTLEDHTLTIDTGRAFAVPVPEEQGKQMRSSIMLLGPMLGRMGEAVTSHPGGCSIGRRPIDLHLYALRKLGAEIRVEGEQITASAAKLKGAEINLSFPSVGATENAVMAAAAAEGTTRIRGAAREPEIRALCEFLQALGARIDGIGGSTLVIHGGAPLHDGTFAMPGDRIVAGTYLGAVAAAGGEVFLRGAPREHMEESVAAIRQMGAETEWQEGGILARMKGRPHGISLRTGPYPEFPTDLQSVMVAAASAAEGESRIEENIFEERFAIVKELQKLDAHIIIEDKTAQVRGCYPLRGSRVQATDLRGGAALVVAGLAAEGETEIHGYRFISRGYEDICRDLAGAGARICLTGS